ncbi:Sh3 and fch domain-containing protein [Thalictrum thalictroides]|uniref:Sh3 and fch domain-containing protein n=1 Tax=Thalictrum thalictroides TaxID=46969 RepID=A0A7J6VQR6_THATH|nr:Sh3 and fch domain-containing protein [Thalictrum thalictroides]
MASPSSSDTFNGEVVGRRPPKRNPPYVYLIPLIYAPALPLIRIAFRKNPVVRDRLFTGVLAGGLFHGFYLISDLYDVESK